MDLIARRDWNVEKEEKRWSGGGVEDSGEREREDRENSCRMYAAISGYYDIPFPSVPCVFVVRSFIDRGLDPVIRLTCVRSEEEEG